LVGLWPELALFLQAGMASDGGNFHHTAPGIDQPRGRCLAQSVE
jgi:hypothetical protein